MTFDPRYNGEFRRCLIELDVAGIIRLHRETSPHIPPPKPADALISLHMARFLATTLPRKLRAYSHAWLKERNITWTREDGWIFRPPDNVVAEGVGIASKSQVPGLSQKIVHAMSSALLNGIAKGIIEPPMQREVMLKARDKVRFKLRHI